MPSFDMLVLGWIGFALILVPIQFFIAAPYGRHMRKGWGPSLPNRLGWFIMEIVSPLILATLFVTGTAPKSVPSCIFFAVWIGHYVNRSLIFPLRIRTRGKSIPLLIVLWAIAFNIGNASLNGVELGSRHVYTDAWLADPRFIVGMAVFVAGAGINVWADSRLIGLRKEGASQYAIPHGGLFAWVSCPNLFGEVVQWSGFALMCWNLPALSFAVWTASNLIPRAVSHHAWYRSHFADYPAARKAVIPYLL